MKYLGGILRAPAWALAWVNIMPFQYSARPMVQGLLQRRFISETRCQTQVAVFDMQRRMKAAAKAFRSGDRFNLFSDSTRHSQRTWDTF